MIKFNQNSAEIIHETADEIVKHKNNSARWFALKTEEIAQSLKGRSFGQITPDELISEFVQTRFSDDDYERLVYHFAENLGKRWFVNYNEAFEQLVVAVYQQMQIIKATCRIKSQNTNSRTKFVRGGIPGLGKRK